MSRRFCIVAIHQGLMAVCAATVLSLACAENAAAQPGAGPRETVNQTFTTTRPGSPTGLSFTGAYHAVRNLHGNPPYMRRMEFDWPPGMRYDRTALAQCTAPDPELEVFGPAACPPDSRLGGGTTEGLFFDPATQSILLDHYTHSMDAFNSPDGEILLIHSEGYTVVHGRAHPNGSVDYQSPTCFPAPPTGQCPRDYVLQLRSSMVIAPHTKVSGRSVRSYATTPSTCPSTGYWKTTFRFWWADGNVDTVVSKQPCRSPRTHHHRSARHRHQRLH